MKCMMTFIFSEITFAIVFVMQAEVKILTVYLASLLCTALCNEKCMLSLTHFQQLFHIFRGNRIILEDNTDAYNKKLNIFEHIDIL